MAVVYRVERNKGYTVMSNFHLKDRNLTMKAKGLLSMMLSLPDEWNYSTRGLAAISKEGVDAIGAGLKELEKAGYIVRNQKRDDKGRISCTEYVIYEQPQKNIPPKHPELPSPDTGLPCTEKPYLDNPDMVCPDTEKPDPGNTAQLNKEKEKKKKENTDVSSTHPINPSVTPSPSQQGDALDRMDRIELANAYRDLILSNIEYDILVEQHGAERLDEVVDLILETVLSRREYIRIAGDDYPREVVKSRMLKLNSSHVEYVFDCIDKNTTKIHNIKAYLLTALYNSPATHDSYYRAEVNHDLYGGM